MFSDQCRGQRRSTSYKRHMNIFLTQNLTIQITIIGIKEAYYILMSEPKSNESVAKGMVNQSRWEGNVITSKTLETCKRFSQFMCPQITRTWESFGDQHAKSFYRRVSTWVRNSSEYTLWSSWIKLGSVVISRITCGGIRRWWWWKSSHQVPGVCSSSFQNLKNRHIRNLQDPVDARLGVILNPQVKMPPTTRSLHVRKATLTFSRPGGSNETHFSECMISHRMTTSDLDKIATRLSSGENAIFKRHHCTQHLYALRLFPSICIQEFNVVRIVAIFAAVTFPEGEILRICRASVSSSVFIVLTRFPVEPSRSMFPSRDGQNVVIYMNWLEAFSPRSFLSRSYRHPISPLSDIVWWIRIGDGWMNNM